MDQMLGIVIFFKYFTLSLHLLNVIFKSSNFDICFVFNHYGYGISGSSLYCICTIVIGLIIFVKGYGSYIMKNVSRFCMKHLHKEKISLISIIINWIMSSVARREPIFLGQYKRIQDLTFWSSQCGAAATRLPLSWVRAWVCTLKCMVWIIL